MTKRAGNFLTSYTVHFSTTFLNLQTRKSKALCGLYEQTLKLNNLKLTYRRIRFFYLFSFKTFSVFHICYEAMSKKMIWIMLKRITISSTVNRHVTRINTSYIISCFSYYFLGPSLYQVVSYVS